MFESLLQQIVNALSVWTLKDYYDKTLPITDATDFAMPPGVTTGFFLYVGVTGPVQFTDISDSTMTKVLIAGYHKIRMKKITGAGTTATGLIACFN